MTDTETTAAAGTGGGRRSGGRAGRAALRASHVIERVPYLTRTMTPFEIVSEEGLATIEAAADTILGLAPLFHVTGLIGHVSLALLTGSPLVLFYRFDADEAFGA